MKNIADAAVRATRTIRAAAAEAGANTVIEVRMNTLITRNCNPRLLMVRTLARCE